jgi:DNA-directed RNA polymerase subunit RPC12/RpoP
MYRCHACYIHVDTNGTGVIEKDMGAVCKVCSAHNSFVVEFDFNVDK